jgi:hypothetical protein
MRTFTIRRRLEDPTDWAKLFADLEKQGSIPAASGTVIDSTAAEFRAMYLDLADVQRQIRDSLLDPPLVITYADVLNIPDGLDWLLQGAVLMVVARRVQVGAAVMVTIDYRTSRTASFVLFTNDLAGPIRVAAVTGQGAEPAAKFLISTTPHEGGVQIAYRDGGPGEFGLTRAHGMALSPAVMFQDALTTEFLFASLLYDQDPPAALAMVTWLKDWCGESKDLYGLFLRSAALVSLLGAQVNAQKGGAAFVPYLTPAVYAELAAAFAAEAGQYESDYMALSTQQVVTENDIKLARALLDNQTYQSEYVAKLLAQAEANYNNAVAAADASDKTFRDAQQKADLTRIDFQDIGIPEWEREQIVKAIIDLVGAGITFGVGIAGMLVGNEAGGAASAQAAVQGAEAVEQAAKVGSKIAQMAKELADIMKRLKSTIEALNKVYEFLREVVRASQEIQDAEHFIKRMKEMDVSTGGADLSATYAWQVYQLNADATLQAPIDKGVGFAKELKLAIDEVAIYGQALAAAQLAVVNAGQRYATVRFQKELAAAQQKRLEEYVDSLRVGEAPIVAMMQQFYQRYLDAKSSLFAALEGYRTSFFYWALEPSSIEPKIIDPVSKIDTGLKDITAIALDKENALRRFSPPPQTMKQKLHVVAEQRVLDALRTDRAASWTIGLSAPTFAGFDRVRLRKVRVWLEGARPNPEGLVNIMIETAGNYLDRYEDGHYQFTAKPLQRDFEYRVTSIEQGPPEWRFDDGTYGYVEIDGSVDDEVRYAYFEPTPFGEWRITIAAGSGVDLTGVTRITMEFAGSVIAHNPPA